MAKRSRALNLIEYTLFRLLLFAVRIFPISFSCFIGRQLGKLAFLILKKRRELTISNIRVARENGFFKTEIDERQLAKRVWEHIGMVGSEFLYYYERKPEVFMKAVRFEGEENLKRILAQNKGALLVSGHLGNWELLGVSIIYWGFKINPIVKFQSNGLVDQIIQDNRRSLGMGLIDKNGFLRPILAALKRNEIVSFLMDQSTLKNGVLVKFFNKEASLPRGAAEFALKTGAPVFSARCFREKPGHYQVVLSEEIKLIRTGDHERDVAENTAMFIRLIEDMIREHPEQWLWMHKLYR
ncbi:MAG: lysophospholipid acyltransferase family protein [Bacteroidota bacterium]